MLEDKIFEKIEKEGLSPRPRWFFLSGDILRMITSVAVFAMAIISTGIALYFLKNVSLGSFVLAPFYIFTLLAIASIFIFIKLISRFAGLYKLRFILLLAPVFFANVSMGYFSLSSGFAGKIENNLEKVPVYEKIIPKEMEEKIIENKNIETEKKKIREEEKKNKKAKQDNFSTDKEDDKKDDKDSDKILNENKNQERTQENNSDKNDQKVLGAENSRKNENAQTKVRGTKNEMK